MKRRLLNLLIALSLLLCAAAVLLWVRSHFATDVLRLCRLHDPGPPLFRATEYRAMTGGGDFAFQFGRYTWQPADQFEGWAPATEGGWSLESEAAHELADDLLGPGVAARLGFGSVSFGYDAQDAGPARGYRAQAVVFPLWLPAALFALAPAAAAYRSLRRRRSVARGRCLHCGYDLRATPGQCPECGREAEAG